MLTILDVVPCYYPKYSMPDGDGFTDRKTIRAKRINQIGLSPVLCINLWIKADEPLAAKL